MAHGAIHLLCSADDKAMISAIWLSSQQFSRNGDNKLGSIYDWALSNFQKSTNWVLSMIERLTMVRNVRVHCSCNPDTQIDSIYWTPTNHQWDLSIVEQGVEDEFESVVGNGKEKNRYTVTNDNYINAQVNFANCELCIIVSICIICLQMLNQIVVWFVMFCF